MQMTITNAASNSRMSHFIGFQISGSKRVMIVPQGGLADTGVRKIFRLGSSVISCQACLEALKLLIENVLNV